MMRAQFPSYPGRPAWLARLFVWCGLCLVLAVSSCERGEPEASVSQAPLPVPADPALRIAIAPPGAAVSPLEPFESVHLPLWRHTHAALLRLGEDGSEERPDLASRIEWGVDSLFGASVLSLVAHLDQTRTWSDGTPVASPEVKVSFETMAARRLVPTGVRGAPVLARVQAADERTIRLEFAPGTPRWLARQVAALPILSPAEMEEKPTAGRNLPSGGGLFQIEAREAGRRLMLVPAEGIAPGGGQRVPEIVLEVCPGGDARALRVALGGADVALDVAVQDLERLLGDARPELRPAGVNTVEMLIWNRLRIPDPVLRRAVGVAIDRAALLDLVRCHDHFLGRAGRGFLPDLYTEIEPYPFDPAAARTEADGRALGPIRVLYDAHDVFRGMLLARIESDLARVGIELEATPLDRADLEARFLSGLFDCVLLGFRPPEHWDTSVLWASWGRWNGARYSSARVDSLYRALHDARFEPQVREVALAIEQQVRADEAVTFLLERERVDLIGPRVAGWTGTVWDPLGRLEEVRLVTPGAPAAARRGE